MMGAGWKGQASVKVQKAQIGNPKDSQIYYLYTKPTTAYYPGLGKLQG